MKFAPNTLFRRNFLVVLAIIVFGQLSVSLLFFKFSQRPRVDSLVLVVAHEIQTVQATLGALPPASRTIFLEELNRGGAIEIGTQPLAVEEHLGALPHVILKMIQGDLRGSGASAFLSPPPSRLIVTFSAADTTYWARFPLVPLSVGSPFVWVAFLLLIAVFSVAGAFAMQRHLNRPLDQLVAAASRLGAGMKPQRLPEDGPLEIATVAQGFNRMVDDLTEIEHERSIMLAGVSHDLRTPLTKVRLALGIIEPDIEPALAQQMERSIAEIDVLLEQFLDFARADSAEATTSIDLEELAIEVAGAFGGPDEVSVKGAAIHCMARPRMLRRLLCNLVDNALKYGGHSASPRVEIHLSETADLVQIAVLDRGPGVAQADVARLQRPFVRGVQSSEPIAGAGLGLAIVSRIVAVHEGTWTLSSREDGPGCAARVEIPRGR